MLLVVMFFFNAIPQVRQKIFGLSPPEYSLEEGSIANGLVFIPNESKLLRNSQPCDVRKFIKAIGESSASIHVCVSHWQRCVAGRPAAVGFR
jgi:hypothetical protein